MTSPSTVLLPHDPDHATYSNYVSVETTHLHLDWTIDWEKQLVGGSVKHEMKVVGEEGVKEVVLDTRDLEVGRIEVEGVEVKVSENFGRRAGVVCEMEPEGGERAMEGKKRGRRKKLDFQPSFLPWTLLCFCPFGCSFVLLFSISVS